MDPALILLEQVSQKLVLGSEAPQGSEILPRRGKMSVPEKIQTKQTQDIMHANYITNQNILSGDGYV